MVTDDGKKVKVCSKCDKEKPYSAFHVDNRSDGGRRPDCKKCRAKVEGRVEERLCLACSHRWVQVGTSTPYMCPECATDHRQKAERLAK